MNKILSFIRSLTNKVKLLGFAVLTIMAVFLAASSVLRTGGKPILGDIEITSLLMVVLILFAIPFTQANDAHIKIGIVVDRLSWRKQKFLDICGSILTLLFAALIAVVYYLTTIRYVVKPTFTSLLDIPLYPFKFLIFFSAVLWILVCIDKIVQDIQSFVNHKEGINGG